MGGGSLNWIGGLCMRQITAILKDVTDPRATAQELARFMPDVINPEAGRLTDMFTTACSDVVNGYWRIPFWESMQQQIEWLMSQYTLETCTFVCFETDGQDAEYKVGDDDSGNPLYLGVISGLGLSSKKDIVAVVDDVEPHFLVDPFHGE